MNSFPISNLNDKTFFTQSVFLDNQFILLDSSCPFTNKMKALLVEWGFKVVYSDGTTGKNVVSNVIPQDFKQVSIEEVGNENSSKPLGDSVKKAVEDAKETSTGNEKSRMQTVQSVYNEYLNYITAVYTRYATHKELNYQDLSETVKELCFFIKDNRRFVLRIQPGDDGQDKNFIINHSMRSTVIALVIGLQLRLPLTKLVELGITCILHEIGQIRLPPQLYCTNRKLSPAEKAKLSTHSILGFNIVKENEFPSQIQLGVLQHHERENGSGYPQKLYGNQISLFAKIIGVACSYEAITSPRHFKSARSSYEAMVEILKNEGKIFDDTVIKALLLSLSLFPIGAYVYLSNGKIAQVTDVNPLSPGNPIVSLLTETDENGNAKTIQTDREHNKIVRVLTKTESQDILKQLAKK